MEDRTTSQIIENINKTVGISNTTKQRPLQGNVMAAISKRKHRYYENNCFAVRPSGGENILTQRVL